MAARNTTRHRIRNCDERPDDSGNHLSEGVAFRETFNPQVKTERELREMGLHELVTDPADVGGRFTDHD